MLGVYQDFFGAEAFLATARTEQSLVRHGRRVGYTSDPGVAATGVVAINVKEGLSGKLPRGLPLLSVPKGEQGTEHYETLDDRSVDSRWNGMEPVETTLPVARISEKATSLEVVGVGLDLTPGETVLLVRLAGSGAQRADVKPLVRRLVAVTELAALGTTRLDLDQADPGRCAARRVACASKPALDLRLFGWDADPRVFPPGRVRDGRDVRAPTQGDHGR